MTQDKDREIATALFRRCDCEPGSESLFESVVRSLRSVREEAVRDAQISVWNEAIEKAATLASDHVYAQQVHPCLIEEGIRSLKRPQSGEEK